MKLLSPSSLSFLLLAAYGESVAAFAVHAAGKSAPRARPSSGQTCRIRVRSTAEPMASDSGSVDVQRKAAKDAFILAARAGPKNGVGATADQRADIEGKLAELITYNPISTEPAYVVLRPPYQYLDGTFSLLYTNTTGGASGKLGPLVGDVSQTFEGGMTLGSDVDQYGAFLQQAATFGPFRTSLRVCCESRTETKLDLVFQEFCVSLFGFTARQPILQRGKGTRWTLELKYVDQDFRVLRTNRGNVLALQKVKPPGDP